MKEYLWSSGTTTKKRQRRCHKTLLILLVHLFPKITMQVCCFYLFQKCQYFYIVCLACPQNTHEGWKVNLSFNLSHVIFVFFFFYFIALQSLKSITVKNISDITSLGTLGESTKKKSRSAIQDRAKKANIARENITL